MVCSCISRHEVIRPHCVPLSIPEVLSAAGRDHRMCKGSNLGPAHRSSTRPYDGSCYFTGLFGSQGDLMGSARAERRLAAILAADMVGYSRLVEQNDEATLA